VDVASQVKGKGLLRALDALGRGPMARGLTGTSPEGELASGLPDAPRAQDRMPGRRGGGGAPAVLGDLAIGGDGAGGLGSIPGAGAGGGGTSVAIGASQVESTEVEQARLDAFVRARTGALRACYETQLQLGQRREGTVRMRFAILPTGEVADVVVAQSTLGSSGTADCLVGIVRTWRTPFRPSAAVPVEYPFVFRPSRE
jgi:TonB family protein